MLLAQRDLGLEILKEIGTENGEPLGASNWPSCAHRA